MLKFYDILCCGRLINYFKLYFLLSFLFQSPAVVHMQFGVGKIMEKSDHLNVVYFFCCYNKTL